MSLCDRLAEFFRARPNIWIDGLELSGIAGTYAWRTRVSELRRAGAEPRQVVDERRRSVNNADTWELQP